MTDQEAPKAADDAKPAAVPAEGVVAIASDGAYTLIVAQFPDTVTAGDAYETLLELEATSTLAIDGVVVASRDADGKIDLQKMTEHSTKTGLKWGIVGGVAIGVLFPPSILVGAVWAGGLGAAIGKLRNLHHRSELAKELEDALAPGTSGIVALVEDKAVVEVEKALAKADKIVAKSVDKATAMQIDAEAAAAKADAGV